MQDETQLILVFATSSLIIAIILILVILFVVAYQKRLARQRLKLQMVEQEHQQNLLRAALRVQENERKRIASDLHDDIGSLLSALMIKVGYMEFQEKDETQRKFLSETHHQLSSGIDRVRQISYNMFPPTLERYGLWQALNELADDINGTGQLSVELSSFEEPLSLGSEKEMAIYRVIQELISNTVKHSGASNISLKISRADEQLIFAYNDNGKGLENNLNMKGLGFMNMRSRIQAINAKIEFESSPGNGFEAKIFLPN